VNTIIVDLYRMLLGPHVMGWKVINHARVDNNIFIEIKAYVSKSTYRFRLSPESSTKIISRDEFEVPLVLTDFENDTTALTEDI
jgi:hypothetical protein